MGAYFVRRNSGDPLYRMVLERYVQMATEGGVPQAVYPEGGLSRDGRLRAPKLGLLDYMLKGFDPRGERDLVFIPVGINYDRVLEDRTLLLKLDPDAPRRGLARRARASRSRFVGAQSRLMRARPAGYRFGYACVNFGTPVSMRAYVAERGVDFRALDDEERRARGRRAWRGADGADRRGRPGAAGVAGGHVLLRDRRGRCPSSSSRRRCTS